MKSKENENCEEMTNLENTEKSQNQKDSINDIEEQNSLLIFESPVKINKYIISKTELNEILKFLLYIKEKGNFSNHYKNGQNCINIKSDVFKDSSSHKSDLNIDKENFIKFIQDFWRSYKFNKKIKPDYLFDCLFDGKIYELLNFEEDDNNELNNYNKGKFLNKEVIEEFKNLEKSLDSFKSFKSFIKQYSSEKINEINPLFQEFFSRLNNSFDNGETASLILHRILVLEINNSLIDDNLDFISKCFNCIFKKLDNKFDNLYYELKAEIDKLKGERSEKNNILLIYEKINQDSEQINDKNYFLNNFIDFWNKDKKEEEKMEFSDAKIILLKLRLNLERLIVEDIEWTNFRRENLSSLLFLRQNELI